MCERESERELKKRKKRKKKEVGEKGIAGRPHGSGRVEGIFVAEVVAAEEIAVVVGRVKAVEAAAAAEHRQFSLAILLTAVFFSPRNSAQPKPVFREYALVMCCATIHDVLRVLKKKTLTREKNLTGKKTDSLIRFIRFIVFSTAGKIRIRFTA